MSPLFLFVLCGVIVLIGATVWWQRRQMAVGQRWAIGISLGIALILVVLIVRTTETIPEEIPLSPDELARWTTLAEELGRRCAQATSGPILVIEPRVSPIAQREAVRLSAAREAAFRKGAGTHPVLWETPLYTGWWQMSRDEAEATLHPSGQELAVLWELLPPPKWADSHSMRLVLVLNEDVGGVQALFKSGELACAILPAKEPATAFRWQTSKPNDPVWRTP